MLAALVGPANLSACWPQPRAVVGEPNPFYALPACAEIDDAAAYRKRACGRERKAAYSEASSKGGALGAGGKALKPMLKPRPRRGSGRGDEARQRPWAPGARKAQARR